MCFSKLREGDEIDEERVKKQVTTTLLLNSEPAHGTDCRPGHPGASSTPVLA